MLAVVSLLRTPESEAFAEETEDDRDVPVHELLGQERRALVLSSLLNGYQSLGYYVVVTFVPTFLVSFKGAPPEEATLAGVVAALVFALASPPSGGLSDRVGRKPVLVVAAVAMAIGALPLFLALGEATIGTLIPAQVVLMGLVTLFSGAMLATTTELFTTRTRYTGVAVGFNVGATFFGGTAPLIATAAIKLTDYDEAPAILLALAALAVLAVVALTPETAPAKTGREWID